MRQNRGRALPICQCLTCRKDRLLILLANHWWAKEVELLFCNKLGKPTVRNNVALKLQQTLKSLGIERARARLSTSASPHDALIQVTDCVGVTTDYPLFVGYPTTEATGMPLILGLFERPDIFGRHRQSTRTPPCWQRTGSSVSS